MVSHSVFDRVHNSHLLLDRPSEEVQTNDGAISSPKWAHAYRYDFIWWLGLSKHKKCQVVQKKFTLKCA